MKVKDAKNLLDQDIQDLEGQITFLEGNMDAEPDIDLENLASQEFIDEMKSESEVFDTVLYTEDVSPAEYAVWYYQTYGSDPKVMLGDEEWWTPHSIQCFERFNS